MVLYQPFFFGGGKREDFINTNANGTINLIEGCLKNKVKRFVYVSSPSIYAAKENKENIKEEYNESNKLNCYIESKIIAEKKIKAVGHIYNITNDEPDFCDKLDQELAKTKPLANVQNNNLNSNDNTFLSPMINTIVLFTIKDIIIN